MKNLNKLIVECNAKLCAQRREQVLLPLEQSDVDTIIDYMAFKISENVIGGLPPSEIHTNFKQIVSAHKELMEYCDAHRMFVTELV